jgi:hypothetical protein
MDDGLYSVNPRGLFNKTREVKGYHPLWVVGSQFSDLDLIRNGTQFYTSDQEQVVRF